VTILLRAGGKLGPTVLLTVRGRKSGKLYTTPITPVEHDGQCWLVAPYGAVDWVRNLRAAGEATLTRGRHSGKITVRELDAEQAAPVLKQYLSFASAMVGPYFDVSVASSLEDFAAEAPRHPVFQVLRTKSLEAGRSQLLKPAQERASYDSCHDTDNSSWVSDQAGMSKWLKGE
jgi:deazaflavin-dependent oxidoreductase (nitroreductase family)